MQLLCNEDGKTEPASGLNRLRLLQPSPRAWVCSLGPTRQRTVVLWYLQERHIINLWTSTKLDKCNTNLKTVNKDFITVMKSLEVIKWGVSQKMVILRLPPRGTLLFKMIGIGLESEEILTLAGACNPAISNISTSEAVVYCKSENMQGSSEIYYNPFVKRFHL